MQQLVEMDPTIPWEEKRIGQAVADIDDQIVICPALKRWSRELAVDQNSLDGEKHARNASRAISRMLN